MRDSDVLEELKRREPIFHCEEFGRTRADFEEMMDKDFWEVGASGNIYSREDCLNILADRYSTDYDENWTTSNFQCRKIAVNVYLLTYDLVQEHTRISRRSTIWKYINDEWKILYHQGTIVSE